MKQGYTVEHCYKNNSICKEFPIAEIVNFKNINKVSVYYWDSDIRLNETIDEKTVAVLRIKTPQRRNDKGQN